MLTCTAVQLHNLQNILHEMT